MHKRSPFTLPLLLGLYLAIGAASSLSAQSEDKYWAMLPDAPTAPEPQRYLPQVPEDCRYARILPALRSELEREGSSFSISIPTPDGAFLDFLITPTVVVAPEVAPLYTIKTFKGQAQNAPQVRIRCDISSSGFRALVFMRGQGVFVVEPFEQGNSSTHIVYYKDKLQAEPFQCGVEETVHGRGQGGGPDGSRAAIPTQKRTYRIAIIADDTYRAQFGGMPYMAENVLNSLASGVNVINEVFERDMGVSFALVSNEQCANASIDDHTDLGDIQDFLANSSGLTIDGYDIGHSVLWANTGGAAYLRAVCRDAVKGGGFSGNNASFTRLYIDYAAHEIGHQMGANHTFVSEECGTSRNNFRFEPGEGSTIMAYAGVCGIGHQNFSDPYFHAASLVEMHDYMRFGAGGSCGTTDNTGNTNSPIADALANITIPRETPFVLVGRATDANGDSLTYAWQQYDGAANAQAGTPDCNSIRHPLFRFRPPVNENYRVFPEMPEVLAGNNNGATWEKLPCAARNMAFRMTVRDNNPSWGRTDFDDANVTVANTGPFAVVVPNGGETWNSDLPQTVTWSVNGTDTHCQEVDILFSTNNGNAFTLLGTYPNNGSATITLPATISFNARILIQCSVGGDFLSASTFFDVSDDPFNLTSDNVTFDCFDILANIGEPCENLPFSETVATTALGFPNTFAANPSYTITVPDHFSGDYELRLTANGEVFGGSWREEFRVRLTDPEGNNTTLDAPGGNADEWRPSGQTSPGELAGNTVLGQVSNPAGAWTVEVRLSYNEGPQINANVDISFTLEPVNVNGIATDECECLPPDCPELMANIGAPCDDGDPSTGNDAVTADCDCIGQSVIDCEGVAGGNALPGTPCDDGDPSTGSDTYDDDCNCTGLPIDCEGVAGGNALPGTPCDDGDPTTGNDTYDDDCNCTGIPIDCEGLAGGNALPGTPCDDGDPTTGNDTYDDNCNCTGNPIDCEGIAGGNALPGTACDDGDPTTGNDTYDDDCNCTGTQIDCEGIAGGNALPETACDDGDPNTGNDMYDEDCNCTGTQIDCEGIAGGNALPGTPCDDGDPSTGNDTYDGNCNCTGIPIDCEGVAGGNALPGTACDDGDPTTGNDTYDDDCNCTGIPIDCEGVAGGNALPGTACDDGDPTTGNDTYDEDCNCTGTPIDCEGIAGGNALPGTACDDGDPTTGNDTYDDDCNCTGTPIDCEGVAGGNALPGTACDDGDPTTGNDTYDDDCNCTGIPIDCEGVAGGNALPGTACDDGDPTTGNDTYDDNCNCVGNPIDCEGIAGGNALPGTACDDGDPTTGNDTYDEDCNCTGTPIDCEGVAGGNAQPDTPCDDGDPSTGNDTYDDNCNCTGMPIDCEGVAGGNALPGTACDDGDPSTGNDTYDDDCNCTGTPIDCEGVAGGNALPGTACDDGDPNTGNDTYDDDCNCVGQPIDCEGVAGGNALPGTPCDDGDPSTGNDTYDNDCNCTGLPIDCEGVAGGNALPGTTCDDGDPCTLNEMYDEDCNCTSTGEPALLTVEIQDNPTPAINCTGSPVTLQVSVSNANPDGVAPTWSSPDNGQLVAGTENSLNPRVSVAGTFVLELTDNSTGCTVSDTIVVALDTLPPLAVAQVDGFIGCTNETATLDATQSDFGPDIVYTWFSVDLADTVGTDALQPVGAGGFYVLTVLNTATGCSAADSVFVVVDEEVPPVLVSPAQVLTCQRDTVPILVSVDLPPGTFSLSWAAQSPAPMPLVENDTIARITEPGFYEVTVVNDLTGCELTIGREVLEDREWPGVALASDRLVLSCVEETAFLEASVDSAHSGLLVYQWRNSEGEHLGTDTTLTVDAPGMYFFQAENTENGCTAIDSVLISQDVQAPNVVQETADAFNCLSTEVLLSVAPTGEAADFDLNWSSLTGGTVTPLPGTMTATVDAPGTYELTVTSLANGCDSVVLFEVVADTLPPAGEIALPSFLGCLGQTVSLDASSFGNNGDYDIEWSSADGQVSLPTGSFLVNVDAPGTYTLSVTNPENGCQTIVSTTVELDPAAPMAVGTTSNNELSCGSTATLDGTGSSEGDHYDYEWANVDGMGALPVPASVLTATVDEPGSYVFIVTNTNTGCADTSAAVAIIPDLNLPTAAAQVDEVGCDGNAFLSANLPAGATGQWAISGTGEIVDPTANATEVIGLGTAPVTLTWTISLENCPDFSSATVVVQPESAPEAQNDQLVVMRGATQGDLNVLANDVVGGGVTFELLTEPALGHLTDFGNGNLSYTLTTTLFGTAQDEFRYRICNANCPERCAEALVRVTIERDKMEIEVPNGITPNGDGINDALVFDQLLLAPDKYPDNELIIFSRWGDIVFKAGPYGNNWQGTNMEGQNLPDGTYYYVLRLDIGSGEIIKGDVTILR